MTSNLLPVLRALLPSLPRGPRTVAEHILADPAAVAGQSLEELARSTGTSDSTVTRLAVAAGFHGYRDLRTAIALAAGAMSTQPPEQLLTSDIAQSDSTEAMLAKLAAEESAAIHDTAGALDPRRLERAAAMVAAARQVVVVGIGASGLVASDLAGKLSRIGLVSQAVVEGHAAVTSVLVMRPDDLLVVVSSSGTTTDVVEPFQHARRRGVPTLAVTANLAGPVAQADEVLVNVSARESELRPASMASRTGQLFVVDALFLAVAQRTYDVARVAIEESFVALAGRHPRRPQAGPVPDAVDHHTTRSTT